MIFLRSIPPRIYSDYTLYRTLLRRDFLYRCAYCLRHEYFLGGEAGCCIDHHRPVKGRFPHPELLSDYHNLYWCCRECNEFKGDTWPSPDMYQRGLRFIDPCNTKDDHDLHLQIHADGSIEALTDAGQFTSDELRLWRPLLVHHRAEMIRCKEQADLIRTRLEHKALPDDQRLLLNSLLSELLKWLDPPVFHRPRS